MSVGTRIASNGAKLFSRRCCSALMNYTAADHSRHFGWGWGGGGWGLGLSSVLCVVVNTAWFIKVWKQLAWLRQVPRWAGQQLMLGGVVSVCTSEVTSASQGAAVKSRLASWKRQQSGRNAPASSPSAPLTYHFLNFFRCSASCRCQRAIACSRLLALVPGARDVAQRWCNAGLLSWMFELKFHTLLQSCERPVWSRDWPSVMNKRGAFVCV